MKVIIVGAGIGGLACAIACRQKQLDVLILEQSAEILPVRINVPIYNTTIRQKMTR
jgi:salicylate hydroxylase